MITFLLVTLILLLIPLAALIDFLWKHRRFNGELQTLRKTLLWITLAKFIFISAETIAVGLAFIDYKPSHPDVLTWTLFAAPAAFLCIMNWWGFYRIKKLII